jgi:hypothetical protein
MLAADDRPAKALRIHLPHNQTFLQIAFRALPCRPKVSLHQAVMARTGAGRYSDDCFFYKPFFPVSH